MTPEELKAALAALGRPPLSLSGFGAIARSLAAAKAWDDAHPELAAEYRRLVAALEAETRKAEAEEREAVAVERALRTSASKLERSGVGHRSLEAASSPQDTEALGVVKRWLPESSLTWLALCGARGTGKSVAATWAIREAIRGGGNGAFCRASDIAKLSGFDAGAQELERLKRVHLLVVDDFGTEFLTDYARAQMHELFDYRHEFYGRTIITSNLPWLTTTRDGQTVPGLRDRLGERLADRLGQCGRLAQLSARDSMRRRGGQ